MQRCSAVCRLALYQHGSCRLSNAADQPHRQGEMPLEDLFIQPVDVSSHGVQQLRGHVPGELLNPARQIMLSSLKHAAAAGQGIDGLARKGSRLGYRHVEMHSLGQAMHVEQLPQWSSRPSS